eukprot:1153580-Pelagomonas_calceolata.AAC.6
MHAWIFPTCSDHGSDRHGSGVNKIASKKAFHPIQLPNPKKLHPAICWHSKVHMQTFRDIPKKPAKQHS